MKFSVLWSPYSENELARLWMQAPDRRLVSDAANKIDAALADDPHVLGESRSGMRRIIHEGPLGVIFSVNEQDRKVLVLDVWQC
jgi:mRNA-degrading endonuclease RelE of RelBE toxin-antitoxin system